MCRFSEVYGNDLLLRHLRQAVATKKISHAYLFAGGSGSGKKMLANLFAKTLQCEAQGTEPCGVCQSCKAFASHNHPDIVYVRPTKKTLGVDDIREQILEDVKFKQYQYRYKIYIVEQADTMTVQAQNALLKTLEEPPGYAIFLLLANNTSAFLPTILSRVVTLQIRPLSENLITQYLVTEKQLSDTTAAEYAAYAQGSIGNALALLEDETFVHMREDILDKLMKMEQKSLAEVLLFAKDLEQYKDDMRFLDIIQLWYRDLLVAKRLKDEQFLIQKTNRELLFANAKPTPAELARKAAVVQQAKVKLARNANFRLTMEVMLMELKENRY